MAAYYKKIGGKDYDRTLLNAAESSVKGKGDGRISLKDAKRILAIVSDAGSYSPTEKRTMQYIRDKYQFTPEADTWFRAQVRSWAAKRGAKKTTVKKVAIKKAVKKAVKRAVAKKTTAKKAARPQRVAPAPMPFAEPSYAEPPRESRATKKREGGPWKKILIFILVILTVGLIILYFKYCPQDDSGASKDNSKSLAGNTQLKPSGDGSADEGAKTGEDAKEAAGEADAGKDKAPEKAAADDANTYTVIEKDSLISISEKVTGDYQNWEKIYNANRDVVKDPRVIFVGQKLKLPEGLQKK